MIANQKIARFVDVLDRISQKGFNVPGLIMSSPGYGKTSTIEMFCKKRDYNLTTLIASQYAPDDILGLQAVESGKLSRLTPSWFNDMIELSKNGKRNLLFIDEITTCDDFIQAPLMNLIFTRKLNNRISLPENTVIIAAGNYAEELNNSFKLSLPIVNRFMILNLRPSDYNFDEIFTGEFSKVTDVDSYLGLTQRPNFWDFSKIANFMKKQLVNSGREIAIKNSRQTGLLGFMSVRSVDYSLKYLSMFCKLYSTEDWIGVVGDTLGEKDNLPISKWFERSRESFLSDSVSKIYSETPLDLIQKYRSKGLSIDERNTIATKLRIAMLDNLEDLTSQEIEELRKLSKEFLDDFANTYDQMLRKLS